MSEKDKIGKEDTMEKQPDVSISPGVTTIKDEQGNALLTIELTPNMLVVLGGDGTVIQRSWRNILKLLGPARQALASGAPAILEGYDISQAQPPDLPEGVIWNPSKIEEAINMPVKYDGPNYPMLGHQFNFTSQDDRTKNR